MIDALRQGLRDAQRRAAMSIARGVLSAIDDTRMAQEVQIQLLSDEVAEQIERFQQYGFTSTPFPEAEAVMVSVGGLRGHGIVIAVEDRRYRLTGGQPGEVALYDDQGQVVHLTRAGIVIASRQTVTIQSGGDVAVTAGGTATITAPAVNLGGMGGPAVARVGDTVAGGVITSGSTRVSAA